MLSLDILYQNVKFSPSLSYESLSAVRCFQCKLSFLQKFSLWPVIEHKPSMLFRELSRFIAAGKLHCKIDKVAGVLETNRPDAKNALYQATIKQGDFLLNRIQKLSRVIDLWNSRVFVNCRGNTQPRVSCCGLLIIWLLILSEILGLHHFPNLWEPWLNQL